jgi:hypothetical protein
MTSFDALMVSIAANAISVDDFVLYPYLVVRPYKYVAQASSWCRAESRIGAMPAAG